jgi:methylmalonyl-CoA mutase cobalamin-binding domain/chain
MVREEPLEKLRKSIVALDFDLARQAVNEAVKRRNPIPDIMDSLSVGMRSVGEKFESGEYFLSDLVIAGEISKEMLGILQPHLTKERIKSKGKMVIATVQGDIHDIGKNIVAMMLTANGFKVVDLGTDVSAETIAKAQHENGAQIVGLSALLTMTMVHMEQVIETFEKLNLRDRVRIIVGGAPVTDEFAKRIRADHRAADAVEGVNRCLQWVSEGVH